VKESPLAEEIKDTSPLAPGELSDDELQTILEIEERLREGQIVGRKPPSERSNLPLAYAEERYPRVLLLDGGRGTGKTSLLLTLVHRWNPPKRKLDDADKRRFMEFCKRTPRGYDEATALGPDFVRALRILDFDPLPPDMPLTAGIIQSWRPLVDKYQQIATLVQDHDDEESETLLDRWHELFRVAAIGWTAIPRSGGIVEQVLDREEQVGDWQALGQRWRKFIDAVIDFSAKHREECKLPNNPVFVIMIDDVDLQVGRVRELLPALRLLYHPSVFFVVAADRLHMIDMLRLDFLGQQNKIARHQNATASTAIDLAEEDRWAGDLARSTVEKVFPRRNRWHLKTLSVLDFLAFPGQASDLQDTAQNTDSAGLSDARQVPSDLRHANFYAVLREYVNRDKTENAANLLRVFAEKAADASLVLPGVMTYRAAHQLRHYVEHLKAELRAPEVLARLLSGNADAKAAVVQHAPSDVDVFVTGELAALYRPRTIEFAGYNIVLSARPDFVFVGATDRSPNRMSTKPDNRFNFTCGLIAKMLQEADFSVDATGLQWETFLSLAWTEWSLPGFPPTAFAWTRHQHPRPDELFEQTRSWSDFIKKNVETKDKLERYAYFWLYHQRKWTHKSSSGSLNASELSDLSTSLNWDGLLKFTEAKDAKDGEDLTKWRHETIPLLGRPELGFPPEVQERLLLGVIREDDLRVKQALKRQRRRLVTDAFVAAAAQMGADVRKIPDNAVIEDAIKAIDERYAAEHTKPSPWHRIEVVPASEDSEADGADRER
jgi:hypothetical protein